MSKVARFVREVSEDPEIDNLLSTLSPEEMEELEKDLEASDTDGNIPVGLKQRDQTDKQPTGKYNREAMLNYCEKESKKLLQKEQSMDVSYSYCCWETSQVIALRLAGVPGPSCPAV